MGRLTTATGLRLGKKVTWRNGGLILKNLNCVKLFLFVEQLPNFYAINKWVLGFNYLFGYARVIQKKKYVEVNYYAYEVNSLFAGKLLKGYKKVMRRLLLKNLYKKRLNDISRKNYKLKKQIIVIKKYEKKYPINFYNEKIKDKKNKKILRIGKRKNLWYYKLYYAKCYYWVTKKKMRQIITKYSKKKKLIEKLKKNLISFNQVKKKKKKIIEKTNYNLKIIKNIRPIIKKKKA